MCVCVRHLERRQVVLYLEEEGLVDGHVEALGAAEGELLEGAGEAAQRRLQERHTWDLVNVHVTYGHTDLYLFLWQYYAQCFFYGRFSLILMIVMSTATASAHKRTLRIGASR